MYRLVAIDLDGTLLAPDRRLSTANHASVNQLIDRGYNVVIATGRPFDIVRIVCEGVELAGPQITYNGAVVFDPGANRVLSEALMPSAQVPLVLDFLFEHDIPVVACSPARVYLDERIRHPDDWAPPPVRRATVLRDMRQIPDEEYIKIVGESDEASISHIRPLALRSFGSSLYVTQTSPHLIEFLNPSASKGAALRSIAQALHLGPEEIVAFGDSHNDLTMFEVAGTSVAMGNAPLEVKRAADYIAPTNAEDGVAVYLEKLGLIDRSEDTQGAEE